MNLYEQGTSPVLTGTFVDLDGSPIDPGVVTVKVREPDGTISTYVSPAVTVNSGAGTASVTVPLDASGFWFYRFQSSSGAVAPAEQALLVRESAFDTDASDGGPYFGATIDGVSGRLPDRDFSDTSRPTEAEVGRFIIELSDRVAARIGAIHNVTNAGRRSTLIGAARSLVHLGAASLAEAAGAPEQADANAATSYAQWLWERFEGGLTELAGIADGLIPPDTVDDPDLAAGSPIWSFPNTPAYGLATSHFERY